MYLLASARGAQPLISPTNVRALLENVETAVNADMNHYNRGLKEVDPSFRNFF
jgi:hypothetical protein